MPTFSETIFRSIRTQTASSAAHHEHVIGPFSDGDEFCERVEEI
jgi:hypothetical protein